MSIKSWDKYQLGDVDEAEVKESSYFLFYFLKIMFFSFSENKDN